MKKFIFLILFLVLALFMIVKHYPNNFSNNNGVIIEQSENVDQNDSNLMTETDTMANTTVTNSENQTVCGDGNKPDRNGCCSGEIFQMIDGEPACCPEDPSQDCLNPLI